MQAVIWHASDNCCYLQEALQIEILSLHLGIFNLNLKQVS